MKYELLLDEMFALNHANFGFPVFACERPAGCIPPGGVARIAFSFQPLEVREYAFTMPVFILGGGRRAFVVRATGYHPQDPAVYSEFANTLRALLPPTQQLHIMDQPVRMSFDRAIFGQVPQGATSRLLLVLSNTGAHTSEFEWETEHPLWGSVVLIYPSRGAVAVGEQICCKVSFIAAGRALEEFAFSVRCKVRTQGAGLHDMVLSDVFAHPEDRTNNADSAGVVMARQSVTLAKPKLRGTLALQTAERRSHNRHTTPGTLKPSAQQGVQPAGQRIAQPTLLLGIRGCVAPVEVVKLIHRDMTGMYLPRGGPALHGEMYTMSLPSQRRSPSVAAAVVLMDLHREAVETLLADMLRDVLQHTDVHRALDNAEDSSLGFFAQLQVLQSTAQPAQGAASSLGAPCQEPSSDEARNSLQCSVQLDDADSAAKTCGGTRDSAAHPEQCRDIRGQDLLQKHHMRSSSELQDLVAYILEGTLFNLACEALHGEFQLDNVPRQIVRSLDITTPSSL
jgi:hypothetical protein